MENGAYILRNGDDSFGVLSADGAIRTWSRKSPSELRLIMAVSGASPAEIDPETSSDKRLTVKICALATAGDPDPAAVGETVLGMFLGFDDARFVDSVPYLGLVTDKMRRWAAYDSVWELGMRFSKIVRVPVWAKWAGRWKKIMKEGPDPWPGHAKIKDAVDRAMAEFGLTEKDREDLAAAAAEKGPDK